MLEGFPGADAITNEELIEIDCDVLAPCALEQVITAENAARVRAKMICEGANGPTTPGADEILEDRGILVLPDVLANAGGVVVSYFEWVQGLQEYFWKEYEVQREAERHRRARVRGDLVDARAVRHEHADGRLRARGAARRRGDDDPRPLPLTSPPDATRRRSAAANGHGLPRRTAATSASARSRSSPRRADRLPFDLELVDIGGDAALEAAYREHLPVIEIDGVRAFTYFVSVDALLARLGGDGSPGRLPEGAGNM